MRKFLVAICATMTLCGGLVTAAGAQQGSLIGHAGMIGGGVSCVPPTGWGCYTANPNIDVPIGGSTVVYVMVASLSTPLQYLSADFGIAYDPSRLRIDGWTHCGALEVAGAGWPASGTGVEIVFTSLQSANLVSTVGILDVTVLGPGAYLYLQGYGGNPPTVDDDPLHYPAYISFTGQGGYNLCEATSIAPRTWGQIKNAYR